MNRIMKFAAIAPARPAPGDRPEGAICAVKDRISDLLLQARPRRMCCYSGRSPDHVVEATGSGAVSPATTLCWHFVNRLW